jgi:hypothetical protein
MLGYVGSLGFWLVILRVMVTDKYSKRFSYKDIVRGVYFTFDRVIL